MKVTKTLNWFILSQRTISISPKSIGFPIFAGSRKMKLWLRIGWGRCNHWIKVFFLSTKFHFLLYWFCDEEFRSQMKICGSCKSNRFYLLFFSSKILHILLGNVNKSVHGNVMKLYVHQKLCRIFLQIPRELIYIYIG